MAFASTFELQLADGTPADPPTLTTATPLWRPGDTIPLGRRSLRVIEVRDGEVGGDAVLTRTARSRPASAGFVVQVRDRCAIVAIARERSGAFPSG
jgi:hypothetical protein